MSTRANDVAVVVLAAGQGTRFRSGTAKVLHRAAGRSLVRHVLEATRQAHAAQTIVVVGHQADAVAAEAEAAGLEQLTTVIQHEQLGTGHAVQQALPALDPAIRKVIVLPGDTPMLTAAVVGGLLDASEGAAAALVTARVEDPAGYGRVLRRSDGSVQRIVEHADATDEERAVNEINAGMYVFERDALSDALAQIGDDNAQGEFYLTDVIGALCSDGGAVVAFEADALDIAGVNDRRQLAQAAAVLRMRHLDVLMTEAGVTVIDPAATYVDVDVEVGADTVLLPGTILDGGTRIGAGATIGPAMTFGYIAALTALELMPE